MSEAPPVAKVEPAPRRVSWAWGLVVAAAALLGVLLWQAQRERGPRIEVRFADAAGLEPGAGLVHRGLRVGVVRAVELAEDLGSVRVRAELAPHAAGLAREGARFWIVRPEVSLRGVEGIETVLGPRYIRVEPGAGGRARVFEGSEGPPTSGGAAGGLAVTLRARSAGALGAGSPVLHRGVAVGVVTGVRLVEDGSRVEVGAVIEPGWAHLVRANSRFWASGGVGVDFGLFRGLTVQAESLERMVEGSVSFATPNRPGGRVEEGHVFELAEQAEGEWLGWSPVIPAGGP